MSRPPLMWTDHFGRSYEYSTYQAAPIAGAPIEFSADATLAVAEASSSLGSVPALPLAGIASVLYRSESSASSLIEGVAPGPRRILEAEIASDDEVNDESARRVVTNLAALRDAMSTSIPASHEDILRWHRLLMVGHPRMAPETIGAYRTEQNWIGGDGWGPRNGEFIPPRHQEVAALIDDLVAFCARTDITSVAHAAVAHARFEVIHPFVDGNGRVGRMLLQQLLQRRLKLPAPVPVSIPWSRNTDRYVQALRSYQEGDVDTWLQFASFTVIEAVGWMTGISERISALIADFRGRIDTRGESVTARVIDDLPHRPILDTQSVAERYGVTPQTAHAALIRLEEAGIVSEWAFARRRQGRPRRAFTATELVDLLADT
ncbi:MAG: Fic family protein [Acidimicrobiia bacterium]